MTSKVCRYKKIVVNGKFLTQKLTGVQRYALEIIKALDKLIDNSSMTIELAVPSDACNIPNLNNVKTVHIGRKTGILWEQFELARYLRREMALGIHLCNAVPLLYPKGIACIHDITYKINPQFITTKHLFFAKWWHLIQYKTTLRKSLHVFTVSEYSKNEIINAYHISPEKISVAYNGWQHFSKTISENISLETSFPKFKKNSFYFSLATAAKNKNFPWIVEAARQNQEDIFVVAGKIDLIKLGNTIGENLPDNIILLGYVSDDEAKILMKNCKAFLFPSLYEGFGIPPLEALAMGAKVICSNASCLPEIFKEAVYYIDPKKTPPKFDCLMMQKVAAASEILNLYDWTKSAKLYLSTIESILLIK